MVPAADDNRPAGAVVVVFVAVHLAVVGLSILVAWLIQPHPADRSTQVDLVVEAAYVGWGCVVAITFIIWGMATRDRAMRTFGIGLLFFYLCSYGIVGWLIPELAGIPTIGDMIGGARPWCQFC